MSKREISQKYKLLSKLSQHKFCNEKDIISMQIEDLIGIKNLTINQVNLIVEFRRAIKEKRFL